MRDLSAEGARRYVWCNDFRICFVSHTCVLYGDQQVINIYIYNIVDGYYIYIYERCRYRRIYIYICARSTTRLDDRRNNSVYL